MNESEKLPDHFKELVDDYLDGVLDEAGVPRLEEYLRSDQGARDYFVRYAQLHTDLCLEARAQDAGNRALERLQRLTAVKMEDGGSRIEDRKGKVETVPVLPSSILSPRSFAFSRRRLAIAAGLLIAVVAGGFVARARVNRGRAEEESAIAWLVNAQDCSWSDTGLTGNLQPGATLKIERGLAEFYFQCGARIILEGPSEMQLLSDRSVRLVSGKLTARVPAEAVGFEVLSPQGKVVDLGTEFGVRSSSGVTEVYVFKGQVEADPASEGSRDPDATALTRPARLMEHQAARMTSGTIRPIEPTAADGQFVRTIVAPPVIVPRTLRLAFDRAVDGTIRDRDGLGAGLTHRLPGTGQRLAERDANLHLNRAKSQLELTTTDSDLNTQYKLQEGEYFGVRLADLGFTGKEDFAVAVTIPNIPALDAVGQFGLYAGARSDRSIRGGLIGQIEAGLYTQFTANNDKGIDTADCWNWKVGLSSTGADLRLTFKRTGGKYSLTVENLITGSASTLNIRHTDFLDEEKDLYVGLFGANTQSKVSKTLIFKDFQATVWTEKK